MIFAKIRFVLNPQGGYMDETLSFRTDDVADAAMQAAVLCSGYMIGCGRNAIILQVAGTSSPNAEVHHMPQGWPKLYNMIENLNRRSA